MKQTLKLATGIIILMLCYINFSSAQFNAGGINNDKFAETSNINSFLTIRRGGMGDFTNTIQTGFGPPMAAFHINANLLTPVVNFGNNNFFLSGEVFRTDATSVNLNAWRLFTGGQNAANPASEKFSVEVPAGSNNVILQARQNGAMLLNTNNTQRMTIANGTYNSPFTGNIGNATKVSIHWGPATGAGPNGGVIGANGIPPVALLNIGTGIQSNSGMRTWMQVGTFYSYDTDNMYIGMKQEAASNRNDAVIVWADDGGAGNTDNLRFIFNAPLISGSSSNSQLQNGMEVARMCPNGNSGFGNFYFFGQSTVPNRKVEILDYNSNSSSNANLNQPQLRLTHTYNTNASLGRFTDFQTTANGDLAVLPFNSFLSSGLQPRNVGIQTTTPRRRLEVFDSGAGTFLIGRPQLRLTQADNSSTNVYTDFQTTSQGDLFINPAILNVVANSITPRNTGIQTFFPQNTLEINSPLANDTTVNPNNPSPSTGESGLRFTDLTSASTPFANPGTGVLSVDAEGDVILVNDQGGNVVPTCSSPSILSSGDGAMDLNGNNFYFLGNGSPTNDVAAGFSCGSSLSAKINALQTGNFIYNNFKYTIGTYSLAKYPFNANQLYSIGVWGDASTNNGFINIGIFGTVSQGINNFAGYFLGDLYATGISTVSGNALISDEVLKTDIAPFSIGLSAVRNIEPVSFRFNGKAGLDSTENHIGVIAEEIRNVAPFAVDTFYALVDSSDADLTALLSVKSEALMFTTINAVKELDSIVTAMSSSPSGGVTTTGSPSAGTVPVFTSDSTIGNSNIYDNGTNVGIGTTSPTSKLHITGTGSDPSAGSLRISDSNGSPILQARNDGKISFGSSNSVPAAKYEFINNSANPTPFERTLQIEHNATGGNHAAMVINCNDNGSGNTAGLAIGGSYTGLNSGALSVSGNAFIGESGGNNSGVLLRMTSNTKQYGINLTQSASIPAESSYGVFVVNNSTGGSACCGANPQYNYGVFAQMTANTAPANAMVAARFDSPDYGLLVPTGKVGMGTLFPTHLLELGQNDGLSI